MAEPVVQDERVIAAQAAKFNAEAAKAEAEARFANAQAREMEHAAWELDIHKKNIEASDEFNHVFRFEGAVSEKSVKNAIQRLTSWHRQDPTCDIEIVFNSPGGDIINGMALFDFIQSLREEGHYITTGTIGMAASMAGILLQAGDHRWVGEQAWVLIHRASFSVWGSTYEVEDEVEFIKRIEQRIIEIFVARSNLTKKKIQSNWDRKDWWITSDEALEYELVDEIRGSLIVPEVEETTDVV